uniref:Uncharacterized protein n=1 Tax=Chromera velia CCMP2878 TaxID=1169474 RepID=A0A0G4F7W5_9ALVE|mmetsp:Transcript_30363/g.59668  ORF Transcript_30363/g.59668 Transcript_30363/m.59668 type:complete len:332 (-) Transcript_30363:706-1701(-)|eukprot:Cvel_15620.t1-p1 / transcript=Cvel_15620.t1 / gene=Cvel_15620 / organism=Chromera_velia_CCMP2878 / gene_product=Histone-lysine N-methyltransferase EHMT2, putative / transcript_product=Histone-lysine N-methyltransferase EHMT2, putative / location=Cvel_scaffold1163:6335-7475(+) / protein_length=331 / sequence_SO=supercontig / SO=protein_coding / is_pseudo=false
MTPTACFFLLLSVTAAAEFVGGLSRRLLGEAELQQENHQLQVDNDLAERQKRVCDEVKKGPKSTRHIRVRAILEETEEPMSTHMWCQVGWFQRATPLDYAAAFNDMATAEMLLEHGALVNTDSFRNRHPLFNTMAGDPPAPSPAFELVELLLDHGSDVSKTDNCPLSGGQTALHAAAMIGRNDIVELLLSGGADVNPGTNSGGRTPLLYAIYEKSTDVARTLIEAGADVNTTDSDGDTALHNTAIYGLPEVIGLLLENGHRVDIHPLNNKGQTALDIAAEESTDRRDSPCTECVTLLEGAVDAAEAEGEGEKVLSSSDDFAEAVMIGEGGE